MTKNVTQCSINQQIFPLTPERFLSELPKPPLSTYDSSTGAQSFSFTQNRHDSFYGGAQYTDIQDCSVNTNYPEAGSGNYNWSSNPSLNVALVDPIPLNYVDASGIKGDTATLSSLATMNSTVVGAAADGAAQLVVVVTGVSAGDAVKLTLSDPGNPGISTGLGSLGPLPPNGTNGHTGSASAVTVKAVSTGTGTAAAFAVYYAPPDFPRDNVLADANSATRQVLMQVTDKKAIGIQVVQIVRPLVVLVHGMWEDQDDWHGSSRKNGVFEELTSSGVYSAGSVVFANYNQPVTVTRSVPSYLSLKLPQVQGNTLGYKFGASTVFPEIENEIVAYRGANASGGPVATVAADVVGHSMGGAVGRTLPQISGYIDQHNFNKGIVHKLITIGTPHMGSPLADEAIQGPNFCTRELFAAVGRYISTTVDPEFYGSHDGAILDLTPDSAAQNAMHTGAAVIPTAMIGVAMSESQLSTVGKNLGAVFSLLCPNDPMVQMLTPAGWNLLMGGASDGIVPLPSQIDGETYSPPLPLVPTGIHSSGIQYLGFSLPSELDQASGGPQDILALLNTPVDDTDVFELKP